MMEMASDLNRNETNQMWKRLGFASFYSCSRMQNTETNKGKRLSFDNPLQKKITIEGKSERFQSERLYPSLYAQEHPLKYQANLSPRLCSISASNFISTFGQFHQHFMSSFCVTRFTMIHLSYGVEQGKAK